MPRQKPPQKRLVSSVDTTLPLAHSRFKREPPTLRTRIHRRAERERRYRRPGVLHGRRLRLRSRVLAGHRRARAIENVEQQVLLVRAGVRVRVGLLEVVAFGLLHGLADGKVVFEILLPGLPDRVDFLALGVGVGVRGGGWGAGGRESRRGGRLGWWLERWLRL